ncbi:hypothetical protein ESZ50_08765 [Weissella muntiaci]|uniref:Uncharacterized protein n=1 Tax=Weissella muntiaci TaxID=2508881 RepID=A0A6C2C4D4_9LACO|nr:hypothetical protein [Weissella muntiaci]TYC48443.1 hypothetical protein ESZ50_08765 [Weissella muntiaci]
MSNNDKYENSLIFNLAKYTMKNGPFMSGTFSAIPLLNDVSKTRIEIAKFFDEFIQSMLSRGDISDVTRQVLSNTSQKILSREFYANEAIEYVTIWMKKIADRQEMSSDEKLIMDVFSSDIYLEDIDIDKTTSRILGPGNG